MSISPYAGKPARPAMRVHVPELVTAYYTLMPDPAVREQRVVFGTSGHRGCAFDKAFNEPHILAISQAVCRYREQQRIDGPLFLGMDTHALSVPAHDGGIKYNPPHGGPAESAVTSWIEARANAFLENGLKGMKRISHEKALRAITTHCYDYLNTYIADLAHVLDMDVIKGANITMGVDPLGGAGVHYWGMIAERYGLNLTVINDMVDPTFGFMTVDWDGQIRMDPSSPYAMQRLIEMKDRFDLCLACDTDHDRHGIVTRSAGLMPPNHYLSVAVFYLFQHRHKWRRDAAVGKTAVSSGMIDRITSSLGRKLYEVPVGFKWFVDGLLGGTLGLGGEESAGLTFSRLDGRVWTTDKDGLVSTLLAAEIMARMDRDPGEIYRKLTVEFGEPHYKSIDAPASPEQKDRLAKLSPRHINRSKLAGEKIQTILTEAPGNGGYALVMGSFHRRSVAAA